MIIASSFLFLEPCYPAIDAVEHPCNQSEGKKMPSSGMQDKEPLLSTTIDLSHASSSSSSSSAAAHTSTSRSSSMGRNSRTPASSSSRSSMSHEGNFVRVIERNVEYLRGQFEEVFASRSSQSLFVPVICGSIFFLYIINTIAWHMNSSPLSRDPLLSGPGAGQKGEAAKNEDEDPAFEPNLPQLVKLLTISPGSLLIPYNWLWHGISILTYPFIELYFYQVVLDMVVLTLSTTLIDPLWGRKELVRFFLTINVAVGILSTAHYIVVYSVKGDAVYLYGVRIYGLTGFLGAVCVTVKQLLPDSVLFHSSLGKFKHDHIPIFGFLLAYILYLLNLTSGVSVLTFFYGLITSWIYLRYYQFHPTNGTRGDLSDAFAFATFFPNVLQPLVRLISNPIYCFLVRMHVCPDYAGSPSVRVLSERLTDNFKLPIRSRAHKYHPSGDYEHLQQNSSSPRPSADANNTGSVNNTATADMAGSSSSAVPTGRMIDL